LIKQEIRLLSENFHQEIKAGMEHSAMTGCAHRSSTVMTPEYRLHSGFYFSLSLSIKILCLILSGESLGEAIALKKLSKIAGQPLRAGAMNAKHKTQRAK